MILLDTSILIDLLRGDIKAKEIEKHGEPATCFPVECELYKGTRIARKTEKGEAQVDKIVQRTATLQSNSEAAKKFAELKQKYSEIAEFDLMIAATCIANKADIMTKDSDFEKIEEIDVQKI